MSSITSANAVLMLSVPGVFNAPQALEQFGTDDIFTNDAIAAAETMMGVDGVLAAGFIYAPVAQSITLMANSPSGDFFDQWYAANKIAVDVYRCSGSIWLKSINKKFSMVNGALTTYKSIPDAQKTLRQRQFVITWESVDPAPVGL